MSLVRSFTLLAAAASVAACAGAAPQTTESPAPAPAPAAAAPSDTADPRVGLAAGWRDAGTAASNLALVAHVDRPEGFYDAQALGNLLLGNTDVAFQGDRLFLGSFHGFNIYDIADPEAPRLVTSFPCPGGQGDLSVYENLLFMSVEMPNGRIDCGMTAPTGTSSPDRFRGVRIFDISNIAAPRQIAAVQTCRGSHTHTLVTDPDDSENVYIYVSGTSAVRPATELAGCSGGEPEEDPNTALFRIEVIQVPLAAPATARVVSEPRIFADDSGNIAGLWSGGAHGPGTQESARTHQCHDITVYPEMGLGAGACAGNGILLDISDPANPTRIDEVIDPNFAYWHSATFSNEADRVIFTDEWGGGTAARCLPTDDPEWGANAIFRLQNRDMTLASYYKLPAPQAEAENCVAHNGSLVPVPGRDIMTQAWYQGGVSVFDFTDPANPVEIAYFDRGPLDADELLIGGLWSTYWYNGYIYGSEIARGLDVFALEPSEHLTANEIEAAKLVQVERFNPQTQTRVTWPASFVVARALLDQLQRGSNLPADGITSLASAVSRAENAAAAERDAAVRDATAAARSLAQRATSGSADARRISLLTTTLEAMSD